VTAVSCTLGKQDLKNGKLLSLKRGSTPARTGLSRLSKDFDSRIYVADSYKGASRKICSQGNPKVSCGEKGLSCA
jgi:hypothetical protein